MNRLFLILAAITFLTTYNLSEVDTTHIARSKTYNGCVNSIIGKSSISALEVKKSDMQAYCTKNYNRAFINNTTGVR